jgi:hypothetical protein
MRPPEPEVDPNAAPKNEDDENEEDKPEDESKKIVLPTYRYIKIRVSPKLFNLITASSG